MYVGQTGYLNPTLYAGAYAGVGGYATASGVGAYAYAGYAQQAGLTQSVLGGWCGGAGGFAGFGGVGSMTGYYAGGELCQQRTPIYQDCLHRMPVYKTVCEHQQKVTNNPGQMWDVWFDHKDGQTTQQRSPIVLDLNGNGKPDITGKNITGDGRIDGPTTRFDLDPSKSSWQYKSIARRPGKGAPSIKNGTVKYFDAQGNVVSTEQVGGKGRHRASRAQENQIKNGGLRAEYYDAQGNKVGELKKDQKTGKVMYHWGKEETKEETEWLAKNGGDGFLVWDVDKDGQITSSKELFGEFDVNGQKRFKNGYEKLSHYFDKDKDGKVTGAELDGLKIWKDANADGKVDAGELQSLSQHGITGLNTNFNAADMSSNFDRQTVQNYTTTRRELTGWQEYYTKELVGYQDQWNYQQYGGGWGGGYGGYGGCWCWC